MPRTRSRKPAPQPVPNLHFVMICASVLLIVLSMVLYFFAPESKASQFMTIISLLIGFLTGKLSNSFGKPLTATPTVDAAEHEEEDSTNA